MVISSDPFTERLKLRQSPQSSEENIQKQDPFAERLKERSSQYEKDKELIMEGGDEIERAGERGIAQATSRVLETALGTPGNIQEAIKGITGLQLGTQLPTSKDIQSFSEKATKGLTKPQSEFEKKGGELIQDIAAMALPGSSSYSALRTVGIPIAGFLAKEGIEKLGGTENAGNAAKLAMMVSLDLASAFRSKGHGGAKGYAQHLWQEGEKNIPEGAKTSTTGLMKSIEPLEKSLKSGGSSPKTSKALEKLKEIKEAASSGEIEVKELMDFRKRINDWIEAGGGFDWLTSPKVKEASINNLQLVKDKVIDSLDDYAKVNPAFGVPYKKSNEAYAVYHASNYISRWMKKHFATALHLPGMRQLFGVAAKGAAAAVVPIQTSKLIYRIHKSPTLSELYGNILQAAVKNDAASAAQNISRLQKELNTEETTQSGRKK